MDSGGDTGGGGGVLGRGGVDERDGLSSHAKQHQDSKVLAHTLNPEIQSILIPKTFLVEFEVTQKMVRISELLYLSTYFSRSAFFHFAGDSLDASVYRVFVLCATESPTFSFFFFFLWRCNEECFIF